MDPSRLEKIFNVGIIGPGRVAARHAAAIDQCTNTQLWSVAGRTIESAETFLNEYPCFSAQPAYDNVEKMLSDPKIDAVIIATPDKLHTQHLLLASDLNKAILVEKPLCTSLTECEEIQQAAQQHQQAVSVGYHLRWHDGLRKLSLQCQQAQLGQPIHLRLHWGVDFLSHQKWRTDPAYSKWFCLTVLGTHLIDIMRWLLVPTCGEVIETKAIIDNKHLKSTFDETVMALFKFESGTTAEIYCSVAHHFPFQLELYSSAGKVVGNDLTGDNRKLIINNNELKFEKNNPYLQQIENFIDSIKENKQPEVTLNEAVTNVKTLLNLSNDFTNRGRNPYE